MKGQALSVRLTTISPPVKVELLGARWIKLPLAPQKRMAKQKVILHDHT
jgi:hypothetical protein